MKTSNKVILGMVAILSILVAVSYLNNWLETLIAVLILAGAVMLVLYTWIFQPNRDRKTFTIKKGKHRSGFRIKPILFRKRTRFHFKFDESALYNNTDGHLDKLYGISFGHHHENSFRFAWRGVDYGELADGFNKNHVKLIPYIYIRGERFDDIEYNVNYMNTFSEVLLNVWSTCEIEIEGKVAKFIINGTKVFEFPLKERLPFWGYRLYPYIGGEAVADRDVNIDLQIQY